MQLLIWVKEVFFFTLQDEPVIFTCPSNKKDYSTWSLFIIKGNLTLFNLVSTLEAEFQVKVDMLDAGIVYLYDGNRDGVNMQKLVSEIVFPDHNFSDGLQFIQIGCLLEGQLTSDLQLPMILLKFK